MTTIAYVAHPTDEEIDSELELRIAHTLALYERARSILLRFDAANYTDATVAGFRREEHRCLLAYLDALAGYHAEHRARHRVEKRRGSQ